ncbi:helix-turn-helix domain-containing protein [Rhodoferax saidenbachensis]|uniref:Transcriptional regulator n=1 Tax=Rhodoferax saidenbachensis TaxID=1484693 RepID=A0A1P8K7R8_9BURK|nr:helix-turn-helix transcriptional regulator [Rhodoferax saidenbachensis]APW42011.1 transcriptional regulator [Rhodoferax saidenbachensis]
MGKSIAKPPSKDVVLHGFGAAVRQVRDDKKFTQEQLAEFSDMHVTYISQIERGVKNLSLFNIVRVAHGLGTSPAELFAIAETVRPPAR